jgi:hypothetical protein
MSFFFWSWVYLVSHFVDRRMNERVNRTTDRPTRQTQPELEPEPSSSTGRVKRRCRVYLFLRPFGRNVHLPSHWWVDGLVYCHGSDGNESRRRASSFRGLYDSKEAGGSPRLNGKAVARARRVSFFFHFSSSSWWLSVQGRHGQQRKNRRGGEWRGVRTYGAYVLSTSLSSAAEAPMDLAWCRWWTMSMNAGR